MEKPYEKVERIDNEMDKLDNGLFMSLMNKNKDNHLAFAPIDVAINSEDKYPRTIQEYSGLEEVRISRSFDNKTNQNVVRLFTGPKKKQVLVGQYSFKGKFFLDYSMKDYDIDLFHHTDMDGDASASIIYNFIKKNRITDTIYTYRYNYDGKTLDSLITRANIRASKTKKKNMCFLVDLSITALEMMNILNTYETVIMIDHHQTSLDMINSLKEANQTNKKFSYAIDTRCCSTYLALSLIKYQFNDSSYSPDMWWVPRGNVGFKTAALIDAYDLKLDKQYPEAYKISKYFNQYYFDCKTLYSFSGIWKNVFLYNFSEADVLEQIFSAGKKLDEIERMKMQVLYDHAYIYDYTINLFNSNDEYPYNIDKVRFRAIYGTGNSSRFIKDDKSDIPEIDFLIRFRGDELVLVFSAYTDDDTIGEVDLSKFFSKYSMGGGHKKACGGSIYTDDIYELLINIGEDVDKEYWALGNIPKNTHFRANDPTFDTDKLKYKNWKINDLKNSILNNKELFDFYMKQTEKQKPKYINDDEFEPANPCINYEIDTIVRLLVSIYSARIYAHLTNNKLQ